MANRLIHESSPYLLQHAHNPVDWYPWGPEAFERAAAEDKPVLVSIGYAACHWCHVMERESFENEEVAAYMNEHFVCIKVDREEHPDVDHMYMDAVQAISGSGGWPLNVFVTPGRIPFYGGTYYPPRPAYQRPSWPQLLQRMNDIWHQERSEVDGQAEQMVQYLRKASASAMSGSGEEWDKDTCREMAEALLKQADTEWGGFGNAPKFPGTMAINFLLQHYHYTQHEPALKQALLSLDKMIDGGIYDQLGGGFARYSTDKEWLAPHFEKMLYDNALLVCSLCEAYSVTGDEKYKRVAEETIAFAEREWRTEGGGYYSALDADSEGVEGKYYTWTHDEWEAALGKGWEAVADYWGVTEPGNWEHTNILHITNAQEAVAERHGLPVNELAYLLQKAREILLEERAKRVRPLTDDKSLLSWNALMNTALSKAGKTLRNEALLRRAEEHMEWMLHSFYNEGKWYHNWKQGKATIPAKLDDYAYLVQAMIQLAAASGRNELLAQAAELIERVNTLFLHEDGSFYYFSSREQEDIPVRKVETYDGATPSANAVMAHNLLLAGMCMERYDWQEQAHYLLRQLSGTTKRYTYSFSYWAMLLQQYAHHLKTVVITGKNDHMAELGMSLTGIPHALVLTVQKEIFDVPVLAGKKSGDDLLIFVCTQQACLQPVSSKGEALHLIYQ
ncbi:MAG: thioredoxin domain-containing protein [Flavipsychrobacter sp.]|nr:thioredoxin domain-containing protein [Flavipsychrobacter sp.]